MELSHSIRDDPNIYFLQTGASMQAGSVVGQSSVVRRWLAVFIQHHTGLILPLFRAPSISDQWLRKVVVGEEGWRGSWPGGAGLGDGGDRIRRALGGGLDAVESLIDGGAEGFAANSKAFRIQGDARRERANFPSAEAIRAAPRLLRSPLMG